MILYTTLGTNDLPRATAFYDPVMDSLGLVRLMANDSEVGYGPQGAADPSLYVTHPYDGAPATRGNGSMLALVAQTRAAVRVFHDLALANGGTDEGAPGLRYVADFYACYVRDPDGNKLSAVCTLPEATAGA
jgi:catechol 2,3-dioxygenase-like lactoylglutathione lyase family enzyme